MGRRKRWATEIELLEIGKLIDWKKLEEIGWKMAREKKSGRYIKCWRCGREGAVTLDRIDGRMYLRCYHKDGKRCYLGRLEKLVLFLLEERAKAEKEKEQEGGENK
jgi:hypothetical protein